MSFWVSLWSVIKSVCSFVAASVKAVFNYVIVSVAKAVATIGTQIVQAVKKSSVLYNATTFTSNLI
jgi:hypothetical protein